MKPLAFTLSDELRDLLDQALRAAPIYAEASQKKWNWQTHLDIKLPKLDRRFTQALCAQSIDQIQGCLKSELKHAPGRPLGMEIVRLQTALKDVRDGEKNPVLYVKNLPQGQTGAMLTLGLLAMISQAPVTKVNVERVRRTGLLLWGHGMQSLHRDTILPGVSALKGVDVGAKPMTTVFHDANDIIEEVGLHYRKYRSGIDTTTPLDAGHRADVIRLLAKPGYSFNGLRCQPIIVPKGDGGWKIHEKFNTPKRGTGDEGQYLCDKSKSEPTAQRAIAWGLHRALTSTLKAKDGVVIGADEAVLYNAISVLHGAGTITQDPRAKPFAIREVLGMDAPLTAAR